jgi:dUTP pyrophosphatase
MSLKIQFELIHPDAVEPMKANESDAAFDLVAVSFEKKDFTVIAHTGIKMALPPGYEAQVRARSGLAAKGIVVANSPGTIDSGYRGEIMVILGSLTGIPPFQTGEMNKCIQCGNTMLEPGDRVAQLVIQPVLDIEFEEVETVSEDTDRGADGIGSTGVRGKKSKKAEG